MICCNSLFLNIVILEKKQKFIGWLTVFAPNPHKWGLQPGQVSRLGKWIVPKPNLYFNSIWAEAPIQWGFGGSCPRFALLYIINQAVINECNIFMNMKKLIAQNICVLYKISASLIIHSQAHTHIAKH